MSRWSERRSRLRAVLSGNKCVHPIKCAICERFRRRR